ncbi:MAG TPA: MFS transporter [Thermomicrobiales bacterium]|nr:MFS transporter [Thermomicrobiales bacterium]
MVDAVTKATTSIRRGALIFYTQINLFGLGLLGFWTVINVLLLPTMAQDMAPASLTGSAVGLISVVGIGLAMIVQLVAGRASDAWRHDDARRPFIVAGLVLIVPGSAIFGFASSFPLLLLGFVLLQVATNISQAAFQALIPDLVDEDERGIASGVKNGLSVLGAVVGLLGGEGLYALTNSAPVAVAYVALLLVVTGALTAYWAPKSSSPEGGDPGSIREAFSIPSMLDEFRQVLDTRVTFRLAVIAQFLFFLGTYPAQRFLLLFLEDRFGDDARIWVAVGGAAAILVAVIAAIAGGALSDVIGRRNVLIGSAVIGSSGLVLIGFAPTILIAGIAGSLIAVGLGAFQSVNWALMNDDLPEGQPAGALGIANVATTGAGAVAGLFGPFADLVNAVAPAATYQALFAVAGLIAVLSVLPLRRVVESE